MSSIEKSSDVLRGHIPGRRIEDVRLKAQPLGAAEDVPVLPVDLAGGTIGGRIFRRGADRIGQPILDVDRVRQPAIGVERRPLGNPHPSHRRDLADRFAGVRHRPRRIGLAWIDIEKRACDSRIEVVRPVHCRFAERRDRPRIDRERHVHHVGGVIDDGGDRGDLRKRSPLLAEIIDDPGLRRAQVGRRGGVPGLETDDPRRQFRLRKLRAGRTEHADRADAE